MVSGWRSVHETQPETLHHTFFVSSSLTTSHQPLAGAAVRSRTCLASLRERRVRRHTAASLRSGADGGSRTRVSSVACSRLAVGLHPQTTSPIHPLSCLHLQSPISRNPEDCVTTEFPCARDATISRRGGRGDFPGHTSLISGARKDLNYLLHALCRSLIRRIHAPFSRPNKKAFRGFAPGRPFHV